MGKESDLYDPLNTKTICGDLRLDVGTYENVQDNIHLEGVNRKLLELTDLIGRVTNNRSSSGPIPNTGKLVYHSQTTNTQDTVFQPEPGQVWVVMGADASSFGTGQNGATLFLTDGVNFMVIADSSSAGDMNDHGFRSGVFIDNNLYLAFQPNNISSGTAVLEVALMRVR